MSGTVLQYLLVMKSILHRQLKEEENFPKGSQAILHGLLTLDTTSDFIPPLKRAAWACVVVNKFYTELQGQTNITE